MSIDLHLTCCLDMLLYDSLHHVDRAVSDVLYLVVGEYVSFHIDLSDAGMVPDLIQW
ncbi:hypothetical protein DPMN_023415 [Dreissena polymorpha]|uniref:Uncharacterized protein n=1 Tax=Dreissena polymorpha TaxID=45954 RepID=A0A9D4LMN5_DREPO|nr:hypothetical protein DPMN_023415 [Dreissena polymorpha]